MDGLLHGIVNIEVDGMLDGMLNIYWMDHWFIGWFIDGLCNIYCIVAQINDNFISHGIVSMQVLTLHGESIVM